MIAARRMTATLAAVCVVAAASLVSAASALAAPPLEAETTAATHVTGATAVLNGVVNPHSRSLAGWSFEYKRSAGGEICTEHASGTPFEPEAEVEAEPVHVEVTGLAPDTHYTFCLVAFRAGQGSETGREVQFTTRAVAPPPFGSFGSGSGALNQPVGVGVDQAAAGDVYVADAENDRIDRFDPAGTFIGASGWDVDEAAPAAQLQTCTTACQRGSSGSGAGQFASEGPQGLAVDNEPLSLSYGDVYVFDQANNRVEKFNSAGEFLLMFGEGVNETGGGNVCLTGESCGAGTRGTAAGQLEGEGQTSIAVGPGGAVYVGDKARVQVFAPSGAWRESISLAGLSSTGRVGALAVDAAGDIFLEDEEASGVRELAPNGTEKAQLDAGSTGVEALATDAAGDLFVGDSTGGFHILKFDPAGAEIASFGSHTVTGTRGMAFSESSGAAGDVYVSDVQLSDVWALPAPAPGPLVEPNTELATPGQRGTATLEASVNPEGEATTFRFEYVDQAHFQVGGYAGASSTPAAAIGSSFEDQSASAALTGLVPGGTYHYRVLATNSKGTSSGPDQTFTTIPSALVEGPWATNVTSTSATLSASIDPLGASTNYRLEFGTSTAYGQTSTGTAGSGDEPALVSFHRQDLQPATTYHYRVVTENEVGTVEGSDHAFTTQSAGGETPTLPDGRAWELVSPPNKNGALIEGFQQEPIQAASDGSGIAYFATLSPEANPAGKAAFSQILSTREAGGWHSRDITLPHRLGHPGEIADEGFEYHLFSPDLSLAAIEQRGSVLTPLSSEATEGRLYLRNNSNGVFQPLLTAANLPPGTKLEGRTETAREENRREFQVELVAATPDLSHLILQSERALTSDATEGHLEAQEEANLYEWSAGQLQLVNILPGGGTRLEAGMAGEVNGEGSALRAVSSDGRWVAWTTGNLGHGPTAERLYVRDMIAGKTVQLGGSEPRYQTMSSDGSRIFFLERGDLYEFDTATGLRSDLTANHSAGESNGGVQEGVLGISEDGSYVYFVATGALASGAVAGEDNLYLAHDDEGKWTTSHIATLSSEDEHDWYSGLAGALTRDLGGIRSRVSPDGRYLAFMSNRSLTGYDNLDAASGRPDDEVYLFDAQSDHLACASCNPTGARPVGVFDNGENVLMDRNVTRNNTLEGHWLAGVLPGWYDGALSDKGVVYQPRYLSDSGRLFFDSPSGLVPQDTNGLMDAYEYEPVTVGSCTAAEATFSERSGGCVSLISSGTSNSESAFFAASENGDDVFFLTASRLSAADYDTSIDVYDAHVCSAAVPCVSAPVSPPPCTTGDACKAAPAPQPPIFGAPASATFSGAGNVVPEVKKPVVRRRAKPLKCKRGSIKEHKKCVKKARSKKTKAKKPGNHRRAMR